MIINNNDLNIYNQIVEKFKMEKEIAEKLEDSNSYSKLLQISNHKLLLNFETTKLTKLKRQLVLKNICLKEIDDNAFLKLNLFEELDLSNNQIQFLGENLFLKFSNLKVLNLSDNYIEELNHNVFNGLTELVNLNLNGNPIKKIDPQTFDNILSLEILDIKFKHNEKDEVIFSFLQHPANINSKSISFHGRLFEKLLRLKKTVLKIEGKFNADYYFNFFVSSVLEILSVEVNRCSQFKIDFNSCKNLPGLKQLILINTSLESQLESLFFNFPYLEKITLNNTNTGDINLQTELKNIQELIYTNNIMNEVNKNTFFNFKNLEIIDLTGCKIKDIKDSAFNGLDKLKSLNLKNNEIKMNLRANFIVIKSLI